MQFKFVRNSDLCIIQRYTLFRSPLYMNDDNKIFFLQKCPKLANIESIAKLNVIILYGERMCEKMCFSISL